ncbi:MAG: hypothetical protein IMW92_07240 [Bacillales bacterium]|nr:hypothetical protein [Bacillales bacterium]
MVDAIQTRAKKLDSYKKQILSWLKEHPDMATERVEDGLKEKYPSLQIAESTVRAFVRELHEDNNIQKNSEHRLIAGSRSEMGEQMQVEFGQTSKPTRKGIGKALLYAFERHEPQDF